MTKRFHQILVKLSILQHVSGKSSANLATAAVYLACILLNERCSQLEVERTVGLTDVAVRNAYSSLVESLDIDILM